jgi:hypothetical protein
VAFKVLTVPSKGLEQHKLATRIGYFLFKLYFIYIKRPNYFWPHMIIGKKKLKWNNKSTLVSKAKKI